MTILSIALANAVASASGSVVPGVSSGVSLSTGSVCADPVVQKAYWWVLVDLSEVGFLGWNFQKCLGD